MYVVCGPSSCIISSLSWCGWEERDGAEEDEEEEAAAPFWYFSKTSGLISSMRLYSWLKFVINDL